VRIYLTLITLLVITLISIKNIVFGAERAFTGDVKVFLDKEFQANGDFAGVAEKAVSNINEILSDTRLVIYNLDEDFGFYAWIDGYIANGLTASEWSNRYFQDLQEKIYDYPEQAIFITSDVGDTNFAGGTHQRTYANIGSVRIAPKRFKELTKPEIALFHKKYGSDYEQVDVLQHELTHTLQIQTQEGGLEALHLLPPYWEISKYKKAKAKNQYYETTAPLMSVARRSMARGYKWADIAYIWHFYGIPPEKKKIVKKLDVTILDANGNTAIGLNIAARPTGKKYSIDQQANRAASRSTFNGTANLILKNGKYKLAVRALGVCTDMRSCVEGERGQTPFVGVKYVCKKKIKDFREKQITLCDNE
jgi:hypothetical protein